MNTQADRNTEYRTRGTLFLSALLLLTALAPRAAAMWAKATGGTVTNYVENGTNFTAHVFTTVGTDTIEFGVGGTIEYLVVGGGGGGAWINNRWSGGGGGAGGFLTGSTSVAAQVYTIVVGGGGASGDGNIHYDGYNGGNSAFTNSSMTNLVAIGGGPGGSGNGGSGGSGGGSGGFGGSGGVGTLGQGNNGGVSRSGQDLSSGAGGGGAGETGHDWNAGTNPHYGGIGKTSTFLDGTSKYFAGGGGGSASTGTGQGGGGYDVAGYRAGTAGTGGGGAGGSSAAGGGYGGSGIVIVRYVTPSSDPKAWMKITLAGYTAGRETLTNFPVLVVLSNNVANSGFTYDKFLSTFGTNATAAKRGDDLRFVANLADTNGFPYEFESWDTNGASYIWVQVPTIPGDGSGVIWAKWGYPAWLWGTNNPAAVWTNGYVIVAHMPETNGTVYDSTPNKNNGTTAGGVVQGAAGVVGLGETFDGVNDYTTFGTTARPNNNFTFSAWGKTAVGVVIDGEADSGYGGLNKGNALFDTENGGAGNAGAGVLVATNGILAIEHGNNYMPSLAVYSSSIGTGWNYVSVVYTNKQPTIYLNGAYARTRYDGDISKPKYAPFRIGGVNNYFNGSMDEARVSSVPRSTNWIWAEYLNMASNTDFNSYSKVEPFIAKGTVVIFR